MTSAPVALLQMREAEKKSSTRANHMSDAVKPSSPSLATRTPPPERARPAQRFAHLIIPFKRIHSTWQGTKAHIGRRDAGRLVKHERHRPPSAVSTASAAVVRLEASQIASIGRVALLNAVGKSVARKLKGKIEKGPWQIWLSRCWTRHWRCAHPSSHEW